ncbi:EFH1 [Candida pseudojiufengensis]|uniref:EFH1 n=1 Tax=Candida pseudojiufengensis TaxID=497109 RepID=UPI002224BE1C|nr:EFH1 [Candida pseudojiufengensis]KAI5966394.1 EFH1 [Candida pseudojiufengensis]
MNKVMTTPSNASFYGQDLVGVTSSDHMGVASKEQLQTQEKQDNLEQPQPTLNQHFQQPLQTPSIQKPQSNKQLQSSGFEGLNIFPTVQNSNKNQKNYSMEYPNYYGLQPGYPVVSNNEFSNNASSIGTSNGLNDYQNYNISPTLQGNSNLTSDMQSFRAKQTQHQQQSLQQPSHQTQSYPQTYSQQNAYYSHQQQPQAQEMYNYGKTQPQQSIYSASKTANQNYLPQKSQEYSQNEKSDGSNDQLQPQDSSNQVQQQQVMLTQAFGNPNPMLYPQSTTSQYSSYSTPTMPSSYQAYSAQRQHLQPQQQSLHKAQSSLRNSSVTSTMTNKSRHSSTFSNKDPHSSRATSISSTIPQNEFPENIVRPKVATTRWDDENTNCYQVRAKNILVSRREDNNYINCTKLLNVVGMTRGKRDGILKTEKVKNVVKVGSMNLKGVWIPFDRAYEIARNEGVDDILTPLFVRNIKEYFLAEGHKLKSEDDLEAERVSKYRNEEGNFNVLLEASNTNYAKNDIEEEEDCSNPEYPTSMNNREDYFERSLQSSSLKDDEINDTSSQSTPFSVPKTL